MAESKGNSLPEPDLESLRMGPQRTFEQVPQVVLMRPQAWAPGIQLSNSQT